MWLLRSEWRSSYSSVWLHSPRHTSVVTRLPSKAAVVGDGLRDLAEVVHAVSQHDNLLKANALANHAQRVTRRQSANPTCTH